MRPDTSLDPEVFAPGRPHMAPFLLSQDQEAFMSEAVRQPHCWQKRKCAEKIQKSLNETLLMFSLINMQTLTKMEPRTYSYGLPLACCFRHLEWSLPCLYLLPEPFSHLPPLLLFTLGHHPARGKELGCRVLFHIRLCSRTLELCSFNSFVLYHI